MSASGSHRMMLSFLVPWLSACGTWSAVPAPPEEFIARESPDRVRVVRTDGTVVPLTEPEVRGDSLTGTHQPRSGYVATEVAIALQEVREVRTRRTDAPRTALAVTGVAALGILLVAIVYNAILTDDIESGRFF